MKIDFHSKNILIVDDLGTNVLFLESLLEDEGYTSLYRATSAVDAYEVLRNFSIDLILLDVIMPEIDGIEACNTIRKNPSYENIPIIIVTADNTDSTLRECFEAGASDFITKPINITNLKVRLESLFIAGQKDSLILNQNRLLAVNETIQMLAHQWRQPLAIINTIIMNISIKNDMKTLNEHNLSESLDTISDLTKNLSKTLDEFRQLSSVETRASLHNINNTVELSLVLLKETFDEKKIIIKTELAKQNNIIYYQNELIKILVSIYTNSIEAFDVLDSNKGKVLTVSTSRDDESTFITIHDNAGGIKSNLITKVFDPYVSSKPEKNAVGLGLYNAYKTLKDTMDADISIASIYGQTTVTIELPNKV